MIRVAGFLMLALCSSVSLWAGLSPSRIFPRGCEPTGYHFEQGGLYLTPAYQEQDQTLYLLQNKSYQAIVLKVEVAQDNLLSPDYEKTLRKGEWSAFAMQVPSLRFECAYQKKKELVSANCEESLQICQYQRAKFPHANRGTYWDEDVGTLSQVTRDTIKKGILLRW